MLPNSTTRTLAHLGIAMAAALALSTASAEVPFKPWMNAKLSADERAQRLNQELTLDERIALVHGVWALPRLPPLPPGAIGSTGYISGIERLGVPALQEVGSSLGVANFNFEERPGDVATAMPSTVAIAASFDADLAYANGSTIGLEASSKGFNVLLGGGVNLIREPRNGRNFEYYSEDPLLSGVMAGETIRGTQDRHVVATVKHFALNDQETGRMVVSSNIDEAAARESDLLAFEIAIERGRPGSVMCSYNRVNSVYACENDLLLNKILKGDWAYPGWVMSDWGAVHRAEAVANGLDQESGEQADQQVWLNKPLKTAVENGNIPLARLVDMTRRILRSMFAVGLFDHPAMKTAIDYDAHAAVAKRSAEEGIVLLVNRADLLPLSKSAKSIVVIGSHADTGVLSGGGSAQVMPVGPERIVPLGGTGAMVLDPSAPLAAIQAKARGAKVSFEDGRYPAAAAAAAKRADIAIVFAHQWTSEGTDVPDLSLPNGQDEMIAAVIAANPRTIVVLETGGPVLMPWLNQAGAVVEAWYSGSKGGEAIADVLFGEVNPSGRLPITFPSSEAQLPRPTIPGSGLPETQTFDVNYVEGSDVGYRWFAAKNLKPLFPFGYGLSYTRFDYSRLKVAGGQSLTITFDVTNTGARAGADSPQIYLTGAAGKAKLRLIGFSRVLLKPSETKQVSVTADPRLLADFDATSHKWKLAGGDYRIAVGASATDLRLTKAANVTQRSINP